MRYAADRYAYVLRLLLDAGLPYAQCESIAREFKA